MALRILVVAAHADDDILGCGGTLAKHAAGGDEVRVIFLADGVSSRSANDPDARVERERFAQAALSRLGVRDFYFCNLPDNSMDSIPLLEVIRALEVAVSSFAPDVVYTHSPTDLNVDHRIAFNASITLFRPQPDTPKPTILSFEVPSSTEWNSPSTGSVFAPNWYVDIQDTLHKKIDALAEYELEMRGFPHARSIEAVLALATWRGASVGVNAAEAFMLARHIL